MMKRMRITCLQANISNKEWWLEDDSFPLNMVPFQWTNSFIFGMDDYLSNPLNHQATGLLVLGVSSWWKWTSQSNLFWRNVLDLNWVMVSKFFFSPRKLGKMNPFWLNMFQTGWNHQLVKIWVRTPVLQKPIFESTGEKKQKADS